MANTSLRKRRQLRKAREAAELAESVEVSFDLDDLDAEDEEDEESEDEEFTLLSSSDDRGSNPIIKPVLKKMGFSRTVQYSEKVRVTDGRKFPQRQTSPKMRSSTPNACTMAAAALDILSSIEDHVEIWSTDTRGITWGVYLSTRFCAEALQCEPRHNNTCLLGH